MRSNMAFGLSPVVSDIACLDVTPLRHSLAKQIEGRAPSGFRAAVEEADAPDPIGRLGCAGQRCQRSGAAENSEQIATFHSMTSSACDSRIAGTVRSKALAVFKLINSSHLLGCSVRKSP